VPRQILWRTQIVTGFELTFFRGVRRDNPLDVDTALASIANYTLNI
jgi:hypothetical protein